MAWLNAQAFLGVRTRAIHDLGYGSEKGIDRESIEYQHGNRLALFTVASQWVYGKDLWEAITTAVGRESTLCVAAANVRADGASPTISRDSGSPRGNHQNPVERYHYATVRHLKEREREYLRTLWALASMAWPQPLRVPKVARDAWTYRSELQTRIDHQTDELLIYAPPVDAVGQR